MPWEDVIGPYLPQPPDLPTAPGLTPSPPDKPWWQSALESPFIEVPLGVLTGAGRAVQGAVDYLRGGEGYKLTPEEASAYEQGQREGFGGFMAGVLPALRGRAYSAPTGGELYLETLGAGAGLLDLPQVSQALGMAPAPITPFDPAGLQAATQEQRTAFAEENPWKARAGAVARPMVGLTGELLTDPAQIVAMGGGTGPAAIRPAMADIAALRAGEEIPVGLKAAVAEALKQQRQWTGVQKGMAGAFLPSTVLSGIGAGTEAYKAAQEQGVMSPEAIEAAAAAGMSGLFAAGMGRTLREPMTHGVRLEQPKPEPPVRQPLVAERMDAAEAAKAEAPTGPMEALPPEPPKEPETKFATAYHGSPHDFDRFTTQKIGTGEGHQAFGWGLYFSGKKDIAEWYRKNLSGGDRPARLLVDGQEHYSAYDFPEHERSPFLEVSARSSYYNPEKVNVQERVASDLAATLDNVRSYKERGMAELPESFALSAGTRDPNEAAQYLENALAFLKNHKVERFPAERRGKLYTVDLAPEEPAYLDWDKPIGRQSAQVREAIHKLTQPKEEERVEIAGLLRRNMEIEEELKPLRAEYRRMVEAVPRDERDFFVEGQELAATQQYAESTLKPLIKEQAANQERISRLQQWGGPETVDSQRASDLYETLSRASSPEAASKALLAEGIPGIRFKTGSSRGGGEEAHNYVLFDDSQVKVLEKYKAAEAADAPALPTTTEQVQSVFPRGKISDLGEGRWAVSHEGGIKPIFLKVMPDGIAYAPETLAKGHPEAVDAKGNILPEARVVGAWTRLDKGGLIQLAKEAPSTTLPHEVFHAAMDLALSEREKAAVLKRYGNEEVAADAYARWTPAQTNSWFSKIMAFAKRLLAAFRPSWESAFKEVRTGKAFERPPTPETRPAGESAFATAPASPEPPKEPTPEPEAAAHEPGVAEVKAKGTLWEHTGPEPTPEAKATAAAAMAEGGPTKGKPPELRLNLDTLKRYGWSDDMVQRLDRTVETVAPVAERPHRSWADVFENAKKQGLPREMVQRAFESKRSLPTPEELAMARSYMTEDAKLYEALKKRIADAEAGIKAGKRGAEHDLSLAHEDLYKLAAENGAFMAAFAGKQTEIARLHAFWAMMADGLGPGKVKVPLPRDVSLLSKIIPHTKLDQAYWLWLQGLLSGPPTHVANASSNLLMFLMRGVEKEAAALLDMSKAAFRGGERERFIGEGIAHWGAIRAGFKDAWGAFKDTLSGKEPEGALKGEVAYAAPIGGKFGKVAGTPGRLLEAADQFFRTLSKEGEKHSLAWRDAMRSPETKTAGDVKAAYEKLIEVPNDELPEHVKQAMEKAANQDTFRERGGPVLNLLMKARHSVPFLRWVAPFMRTPWNIAKEAVKRTPLRIADLIYRKPVAGAQFTDELAKAMVGSIVMTAVALWAKSGGISGGGPTDPKLRRNKERTGWLPYAVRLPNGSWLQYSRLEPFSSIVGMAADVVEAEERGESVPTKLLDSLMKNLTNKTFLQGVANLAEYFTDPRAGAGPLSNFIGSLSTFVGAPAGLAGTLARATDPYERETSMKFGKPETILSPIKARIPGLRQTLPPRLGPGGEVIEQAGTAGERFLSPFKRQAEKPGRYLEHEFSRLGYVPEPPARQVVVKGKKVNLTDEEFDLMRKASMRAADQARDLIRSGRYLTMDDAEREDAIKRIFSQWRARARSRFQRSLERRAAG